MTVATAKESHLDVDPPRPDILSTTATSKYRFLVLLALASMVAAVGFSCLQEMVFRVPGFHYQGWMTFLMYLSYALCALIENKLTGRIGRQGKLKDYFLVSLLAVAGNYLTNWALHYLKNYTTRIVFKSCRMLPTMAFRTLLIGVHYSIFHYLAGVVLVSGIATFTLGDKASTPRFNPLGVGLISLALVCDAATANVEEGRFFKVANPASQGEVMLYLSLFGSAEAFLILVATRELAPALDHSVNNPQVIPAILVSSIMGYASVSLILLLIKHYGSTSAEVVKSLRKVCQVAASFMLFPKPITWKHCLGGALVVSGLYALQKLDHHPATATMKIPEKRSKSDGDDCYPGQRTPMLNSPGGGV